MSWLRWFELVVIFVFMPLLVWGLIQDQQTWLMPLLCLLGGWCLYALLNDPQFKRFRLWHVQDFAQHLKNALALFVPCALLFALVIYAISPQFLFAMPLEQRELWLITLLIYPIVSVIPQEVIYRTFFFHRYKRIIPSKYARWGLSTLSFAFAHVVYGNWIAVALSVVGGAIFGYRYMTTRSTVVVVVEHTLWGSMLFTIGLGSFFLAKGPV